MDLFGFCRKHFIFFSHFFVLYKLRNIKITVFLCRQDVIECYFKLSKLVIKMNQYCVSANSPTVAFKSKVLARLYP